MRIFFLSPDIPSSHCNEFCGDDNNHKIHSSDSKGHLFDRDNEMMNNSEKLNLKNDSNNNNNQQQNEIVDVNEKDECEQNEERNEQREREQGEGSPSMNNVSESLSPSNGNSDEIVTKFKSSEESSTSKVVNDNANCFSHLLNSIMNFRRDETTFNLNNFISAGANSSPIPNHNNNPANNLLMNDLNRNFFVPNFPPTNVVVDPTGLEHLAMTSAQQFSKYGQGTCKFPGCNMIFDDLQNFTK